VALAAASGALGNVAYDMLRYGLRGRQGGVPRRDAGRLIAEAAFLRRCAEIGIPVPGNRVRRVYRVGVDRAGGEVFRVLAANVSAEVRLARGLSAIEVTVRATGSAAAAAGRHVPKVRGGR
jgi:hypothetical protein